MKGLIFIIPHTENKTALKKKKRKEKNKRANVPRVQIIWYCYKTRSCLDLKKQKERKEEKKKKTEVNTSSS